ncbi:hypothetical protein OG723_12225 [Streptomyces sp. NBC_01278]|uniref:hypothetical protein n=1 Tax=Streptomyces sp. NBC_01278 TaxID=2903809 RepID=UPI002E369ECF|nr:hypothetical protein [Streptomyces sp. NBC_01278]
MSAYLHARLEGPTNAPDGISSAEPASAAVGSGAPRVVARQGVPSSVRPGLRADDGRRPVAWLHTVAPPSFDAPARARSWCSCGYEWTAIGRPGVLQLVAAHNQHRTACPLLTPVEERREVA